MSVIQLYSCSCLVFSLLFSLFGSFELCRAVVSWIHGRGLYASPQTNTVISHFTHALHSHVTFTARIGLGRHGSFNFFFQTVLNGSNRSVRFTNPNRTANRFIAFEPDREPNRLEKKPKIRFDSVRFGPVHGSVGFFEQP